MEQAGIIKTITGIVNARTSDGQVRQLMAGDMVYENEVIETSAGSQVSIELNDGKTLALAENDQVVLDETVIAVVDAQDAVVAEAAELQANLENGEEITDDEELAAGNEDEDHDYDLSYYAGDQAKGEVGSYLFPTDYGNENEAFPDVDGEDDDINQSLSLSAIGVVVDETDGLNNIVNGTITVDYGTPEGTLALAAAGASWDAGSNTLTYQQDGTNIWQIVLEQDTGEFTFEQLAAFDHGPDGNDHNALEGFGVTVLATNALGETATTTFSAGIYDDGPSITPTVVQGDDYPSDIPTATADPADLLSVEGDESFGPVAKYVSAQELGIDFGTDGPGSVSLSMDPNDPNWEWNNENNILQYSQGEGADREVTWQMGLQQQGASVDTWNFTHDGGALTINMLSERLGAIIDGDGETSNLDTYIQLYNESGTQVALNDDFDAFGPATGEAAADGSVHGFDSYLEFPSGALAAGNYTLLISSFNFNSVDPSSIENANGSSAGDYQVTFTGNVTVNTDDGTIINQDGGQIIGQGTIEPTQFGYYFQQFTPINHPDASDPNDTMSWDVNLTVTDSDTDTAGAVITIAIDDDGPSINAVEGIPSVFGDESAGMVVTGPLSSLFSVNFGSDGEAASDALALSIDGLTQGTDYNWDGSNLTFYQNADAADPAATASWTIEITENTPGTYGYEFTQHEAIDHPNAGDGTEVSPDENSHDEPLEWDVRVTAMDGDGDTASEIFNVTIEDDGPRLTGSEIISTQDYTNGITISADLSDVPLVHELDINGLTFSAIAADGTDALLKDAGPGVGVESDGDGDGIGSGGAGVDTGRFDEVNFVADGTGGSSEVIRMVMPGDELGFNLEVNFSEFYNTDENETEMLEIVFFKDGIQVGDPRTITAQDASGNAEYQTQVGIESGFDMVEFRALNDPDQDGTTAADDDSDFGIQNLRVTTIPGAIFVVEGQVFGEPGTDGPIDDPNAGDQFFLWDDSTDTAEGSHTQLDINNNPIYSITMDAQTGEWTFVQFQEIEANEGGLDIDYRIYDGDGDWAQGTLDVPISQIMEFDGPYTGSEGLDGGLGYDTLLVEDDGVLDFNNVENIEKINLNDPGVDQRAEISLDDVLDMTDADNVLHITGEGADSLGDHDTVLLTGVGSGTDEWTQDSTNLGLFTNNGTGDQVTIAPLDDGENIHVDVDSGTDFHV